MIRTPLDEGYLQQWIGKTEHNIDMIDYRQIRLMRTIVDIHPACLDNDELPPLWHWLYFPSTVALGQLGSDGHPHRGGFLPPVTLPRRMWPGEGFSLCDLSGLARRLRNCQQSSASVSKREKPVNYVL